MRAYAPYLSAFIAGGLLTFAFAPFHVFMLAWLMPAVLAFFWQQQNIKTAALTAFCFGVGLFGVGASWIFVSIDQFSDTPLLIAILITSGFVAILASFLSIQAAIYRWLISHHSYTILLLAFPSAWVLGEWMRSWLFTGFPWLFVGYSQIDSWLAGYAPILGVYGLSWLAVLTGVLLLCCYLYPRRLPVSIALIAAIWLGGYALKHVEWTKTEGDAISVALLQGNIPQDLKWDVGTQNFIIERYAQMTEAAHDVDLIVWPEASLPIALPAAEPLLDEFHETMVAREQNLLIGLPVQNYDGRFYNAIIALGIEAQGTYYKRHLVPFGEFVPFEEILRGTIDFFDLPMSYSIAGPAKQGLLTTGTLQFSSAICYEVVYPALTLANLQDANILLTISNDSWFGQSAGPHQHFQMARTRALETGRFLVRSTNNGITAIVDQHGQVVAQAPQFIDTTLIGDVYATQGYTPLVFLTHYFMLLLSALLLIGAHLLTRRP